MIDAGEVVSELVVPARIDALLQVTDWLASHLESVGARDPLPFNFDLCANEALANVIDYGHPEGGSHEIRLRLMRDGEAISLQIEDDGIPFDPLALAEREAPKRLEDAPIGGLGIALIRKRMDRCEYARRGGKNVLRMSALLAR